MKRKIFQTILLLTALLFLIVSCDETETFDDRWKIENETQFAKITANPEYAKINSQSGKGFIMYKELEQGDGATPYFTDQVKVLYTGWYKNDWSLSDSYTNDKGNLILNKIVFDSTGNRNDIPSTFSVNGVVDGFSTALQHMQVGDKWEVWIPWKLGYGEAGNNSIPGYTT
ncbi:MAG: hypothetical protein EOM01_12780, partial [Spirochaetia bacterium]|nr:hypothetical protein [Spirochaetia bacterium]